MKMAPMSQHTLNFLLEQGGELPLDVFIGVGDKVVGIKFGNRLDPANFAEVMEDVIGYFFQDQLHPGV